MVKKQKFGIVTSHMSSATLFPIWNRQINVHLKLQVACWKIPTVCNPRIFEITLDNMLNFCHHTKNLCFRIQSRNNVLPMGKEWRDHINYIQCHCGRLVLSGLLSWACVVGNIWKRQKNAALRVATWYHNQIIYTVTQKLFR